jgi:cytochrome P450
MQAPIAERGVDVPPPPPAPAAPAPSAPVTTRARHDIDVRDVPQVKGWPLLGNIPALRKLGMIRFLEQSWREHGDVFAIDAGTRMVVVAHPDGVERIFAGNHDNYVKGDQYNGVRRVIGNGLLVMEGQEWRARRTLMQPSFHRAQLGGMGQTMVAVAERWLADLKRRVPVEGEIDAHREMVKLTLDVVVAALFGSGNGATVSYEALSAAVELLSEVVNGIPLPEWLPTPTNRKLKRTLGELEGAVYGIIADGRRDRAKSDGTLLGMLIDAKDANTGEPLTDRDVRDEVFTMFVAGHETTALTLTWLFTLLDGRDDVLQKLRAEVDAVCGTRAPTFEDIPKLVYVRQVVDETLRLRGPVAFNARAAVKDDAILGKRIRAGDTVMPFLWGVHRHPKFWPNPDRFDPERFSDENKRGRDPWSYLPFAAGQRICIGNNFALVESVLLIALFVQRLDVTLAPGQSIEPSAIATVRPSAPVRVRVRWR